MGDTLLGAGRASFDRLQPHLDHQQTQRAIAQHTPQVRLCDRPGTFRDIVDGFTGSTDTMQPTLRRMGPPKYAEMPNHPIKIHPVRPLYRFMATGLGASMWFFVR